MRYKNVGTIHTFDRRTDRRTKGQTYDSWLYRALRYMQSYGKILELLVWVNWCTTIELSTTVGLHSWSFLLHSPFFMHYTTPWCRERRSSWQAQPFTETRWGKCKQCKEWLKTADDRTVT